MVTSSPQPNDDPALTPPRVDAASRPPNGAKRPWASVIAIAIGAMLVGFDATITAVANPMIATSLSTTLSDLQWITTIYLLALASTLVLAGKLGDRFGRRQVFLVGIAGFGAVSVAIGLSDLVEAVIAFRGVQGLFGSLLVTNALSLVRSVLPPDKLAVGIGVFSALNGVSVASGPIIGGIVVENYGWEWAFIINGPIALGCLVVGLIVLRARQVDLKKAKFDLLGVVLLVCTTGPLVWAIVHAPEYGWGSPSTLVFLGLSLVSGTLFSVNEISVGDPLCPFRLFYVRSISVGIVLGVLLVFVIIGVQFVVMLYLQNVVGLSPIDSGFQIVPMSLAIIIAAGLAGPLINRLGPGPLITIGMLVAATAMLLMSVAELASGGVLMISFILLGLGSGFTTTAAGHAIFGNVSDLDAGAAAGIQQTSGQIGGILGTSVFGAILTSVSAEQFTSAIASDNLPYEIAAVLGDDETLTKVSIGVPPIDPDTPGHLVAVIRSATEMAFVDGMRATFGIAVALCVLGAAAGLMVRRSHLPDATG